MNEQFFDDSIHIYFWIIPLQIRFWKLFYEFMLYFSQVDIFNCSKSFNYHLILVQHFDIYDGSNNFETQ